MNLLRLLFVLFILCLMQFKEPIQDFAIPEQSDGFVLFHRPNLSLPKEGTPIWQDVIPLKISDCVDKPLVAAFLNGSGYKDLFWEKHPTENSWSSWIHSPTPLSGKVSLEVTGSCGSRRFHGRRTLHKEKVQTLVEDVLRRYLHDRPVEETEWYWTDGAFYAGLAKLALSSNKPNKKYLVDLVAAYHQYHQKKHIPVIGKADDCTPALSAWWLRNDSDFSSQVSWYASVNPVINWLENVPRNSIGSIDHVGVRGGAKTTDISALGPYIIGSSIWTDSLVMWGILSYEYGAQYPNSGMREFGKNQAQIFTTYLQNKTPPNQGLFYHAYGIDRGQPVTLHCAIARALFGNAYFCNKGDGGTFWGRGNGWVMAYFSSVLETLPKNDPQYEAIKQTYLELCSALKALVLPSGFWDTVVGNPGRGYEETSATALFAYGFLRGVQMGILDSSYQDLAYRAIAAINAKMTAKGGLAISGISMPTDPGSETTYSLLLTGDNYPYGVGAWLFLASAMLEDEKTKLKNPIFLSTN